MNRRQMFSGIEGVIVNIVAQSHQISVYKGSKKIERTISRDGRQIPQTLPGEDLKDRFRLEFQNESVKNLFVDKYQSNEPKKLNIYFNEDDPNAALLSSFVEMKGSTIQKRCNGKVIYEERVTYKMDKGPPRSQLAEVEKPCPYKNTKGANCPDCRKKGELFFHIVELDHQGAYALAMLSIGITDVSKMLSFLSSIYKEYGSIRYLMVDGDPNGKPVCINGEPIKIPYILSRTPSNYKYTDNSGARASKNYSEASLDIHPKFREILQSCRIGVTRQLMDGSIDVNVLSSAALKSADTVQKSPPSNYSKIESFYYITEDQINELGALIDKHWEIAEACYMMADQIYSVTDWSKIQTNQLDNIKTAIADPIIVKQYEHAYKQKHPTVDTEDF